MKEEDRKREADDDQQTEWLARFEWVRNQLLQINPRMRVNDPDANAMVSIYLTIFPDLELRREIESHIVQVEVGGRFMPRNLRPDELRSPTIQRVLKKAEWLLKDFRQNHPRMVHHLGKS